MSRLETYQRLELVDRRERSGVELPVTRDVRAFLEEQNDAEWDITSAICKANPQEDDLACCVRKTLRHKWS